MLTPIEVENKRFKKEVFGYNQIEVEDFLSEVSGIYEKLYKDNNAALARIDMLTDAIKQYKSMEETLQNAMVIAQKSGDEIRADARGAAERVVADAKEEAKNIIAEARRKADEVSYRSEELQRSVEMFKTQTIELLTAQLELIKRHSPLDLGTSAQYSKSDDTVADDSEKVDNDTIEMIDLSNVLEKVGKISESIDSFSSVEGAETVEADSEKMEYGDEPEGMKELFDGDQA